MIPSFLRLLRRAIPLRSIAVVSAVKSAFLIMNRVDVFGVKFSLELTDKFMKEVIRRSSGYICKLR